MRLGPAVISPFGRVFAFRRSAHGHRAAQCCRGLSNRSQSDINTHCEQGSYITLTAGISAPDAQRIAQRLQQLEISGRVLTQWSYGRIALVLLFGFVGAAPAALISGVLTHLAMSSYILDGVVAAAGFGVPQLSRHSHPGSCIDGPFRLQMRHETCAALVRRPLSRPTNVLDAYFFNSRPPLSIRTA